MPAVANTAVNIENTTAPNYVTVSGGQTTYKNYGELPMYQVLGGVFGTTSFTSQQLTRPARRNCRVAHRAAGIVPAHWQ